MRLLSQNSALARRQRRRAGLCKNFSGRDPLIEPLLKRRGLDVAPAKESAPPPNADSGNG